MRVATLVLAVWFLNACSWITVVPHDTTPCTRSRAAPIADATLAGVSALTLVLVSSFCYRASRGGQTQSGEAQEPCGVGEYMAIANTTLFGVGTVFSARSGFRKTRACRARGHDS